VSLAGAIFDVGSKFHFVDSLLHDLMWSAREWMDETIDQVPAGPHLVLSFQSSRESTLIIFSQVTKNK
jgi:hypothetical protein